MMEEKSQIEAVGGDRASQASGADGEPAKSALPESSTVSSASSIVSSFPVSNVSLKPAGNPEENGINKELRRLNRALRALSACNQALAQAGSEQELLRQICDIIVHLGGYRMAFIAYAQQDEEKNGAADGARGIRRRIPRRDCADLVRHLGVEDRWVRRFERTGFAWSRIRRTMRCLPRGARRR